MDYKEYKDSIIDYLTGNLTDTKVQEFELFLSENPEHINEFDEAKMLWLFHDSEIPNHSSSMDEKFYSMLRKETDEKQSVSVFDSLENLLFGNLFKRIAYTFTLLVLGLLIGTQLNFSNQHIDEKLKIANQETQDVRSQLVLTLLDQSSASKRLQAVNEVNKLNEVTEKIIKALFSTLNNDPNVNVRLSAIQSLKNYTKMSIVREGLVGSIVYQDSPLVQMELADLMVELQEKKAVKSFKKLIEKEEVNSNVKEKIKKSIQNII